MDLCSNIVTSADGGAFFSAGFNIVFNAAYYLKTSYGWAKSFPTLNAPSPVLKVT